MIAFTNEQDTNAERNAMQDSPNVITHENGRLAMVKGKQVWVSGPTAYGLLAMRSRLKLEMLGLGGRGETAYAQAKRLLGFKGTRPKVAEQLSAWCDTYLLNGARVSQPDGVPAIFERED